MDDPVKHLTPKPWLKPGKSKYGVEQSYRLAATWLVPCQTVADWGGGGGYFQRFLQPRQRYVLVDGTDQGVAGQVLADLTTYAEPTDGILLRHVLDCTFEWRTVLTNALTAYQQRMVIITSTPNVPETHVNFTQGGWPFIHFNHDDLRREMGPHFKTLMVAHPTVDERRRGYIMEHIYLLQRPKGLAGS